MFVLNSLWRNAGKSASGLLKPADSKRMRPEDQPAKAEMSALLRSGEGGQALVEFAFVVPFLLILFTGLFTFGITYLNELTLTSAVGAGAQQLQVIRTTTSDPCLDVFNAISGAAPGLVASKITMTLTMNGNTAITAKTCAGDQSELTAQTSNTVSATYPCALSMYGKAFSSCTLQAQVTEYEY